MQPTPVAQPQRGPEFQKAEVSNVLSEATAPESEQYARRTLRMLSRELEGAPLIVQPMHPDCRVSVVVPAYYESPESVLTLLESVTDAGLLQEEVEVLFVINNSVSPSPEVRAAQDAVLSLPVWSNLDEAKWGKSSFHSREVREWAQQLKSEVTAYVIDKSSEEYAFTEGNVGKARQRGVSEAAYRFLMNSEVGTRGVVFQTDSDSWFPSGFLAAMLRKFDESETESLQVRGGGFIMGTSQAKQTIAVLGGVEFVLATDEISRGQKALLFAAADTMFLKAMYHEMSDLLSGVRAPVSAHCYGANMAATVAALGAVGGVAPLRGQEDWQFGGDIRNYAAHTGKSVSESRDLRMNTMFRLSTRTGGSLGHEVRRLLMRGTSDPELVEPLPYVEPTDIDSEGKVPLTAELLCRGVDRMRDLYGDEPADYFLGLELVRMAHWLRNEAVSSGVSLPGTLPAMI